MAALLGCAGGLSIAPRGAAQQPASDLPPGPMQQLARRACLGCHTAEIMTQQQLDRRVWTREMDKMIRWGAPVAAEDREALIDYFTTHFGPHSEPDSHAALAPGAGAARVRAACLGCHDAGVIIQVLQDRAGWERTLDKMIRWGARVRPADRAAILSYLTRNYSPPAKAGGNGGAR